MESPIQWQLTEKGLVREFSFSDFAAAMVFINRVAAVAQALEHHPDIWNSYTTVRLTLYTHDANAVTEKDYALARQIDAIG